MENRNIKMRMESKKLTYKIKAKENLENSRTQNGRNCNIREENSKKKRNVKAKGRKKSKQETGGGKMMKGR
jgi:hypothetical protein